MGWRFSLGLRPQLDMHPILECLEWCLAPMSDSSSLPKADLCRQYWWLHFVPVGLVGYMNWVAISSPWSGSDLTVLDFWEINQQMWFIHSHSFSLSNASSCDDVRWVIPVWQNERRWVLWALWNNIRVLRMLYWTACSTVLGQSVW